MHKHTFPLKEAQSCGALRSGCTLPFLCMIEDKWAITSHASSLHAWRIHLAWAQLDSATEQRWTEHHFSIVINCSFILCAVMDDWRSTHCSPHWTLNIVAQRGFNGPCFLLFRETTALTKWSDHLKLRLTNVFPAQHRGIVDLCHGRMRVELFIWGFSASFVIHFLAVVYGVWSTFFFFFLILWINWYIGMVTACSVTDQWFDQ